MTRIELSKVVGSQFCVSNEDGVRVHDIIANLISKGDTIELSFKGVTRLTTAFLNAAVGQLYDEHVSADIDNAINIVDADRSHIAKYLTTVSNARAFFNEKKSQSTRHVPPFTEA